MLQHSIVNIPDVKIRRTTIQALLIRFIGQRHLSWVSVVLTLKGFLKRHDVLGGFKTNTFCPQKSSVCCLLSFLSQTFLLSFSHSSAPLPTPTPSPSVPLQGCWSVCGILSFGFIPSWKKQASRLAPTMFKQSRSHKSLWTSFTSGENQMWRHFSECGARVRMRNDDFWNLSRNGFGFVYFSADMIDLNTQCSAGENKHGAKAVLSSPVTVKPTNTLTLQTFIRMFSMLHHSSFFIPSHLYIHLLQYLSPSHVFVIALNDYASKMCARLFPPPLGCWAKCSALWKILHKEQRIVPKKILLNVSFVFALSGRRISGFNLTMMKSGGGLLCLW